MYTLADHESEMDTGREGRDGLSGQFDHRSVTNHNCQYIHYMAVVVCGCGVKSRLGRWHGMHSLLPWRGPHRACFRRLLGILWKTSRHFVGSCRMQWVVGWEQGIKEDKNKNEKKNSKLKKGRPWEVETQCLWSRERRTGIFDKSRWLLPRQSGCFTRGRAVGIPVCHCLGEEHEGTGA